MPAPLTRALGYEEPRPCLPPGFLPPPRSAKVRRSIAKGTPARGQRQSCHSGRGGSALPRRFPPARAARSHSSDSPAARGRGWGKWDSHHLSRGGERKTSSPNQRKLWALVPTTAEPFAFARAEPLNLISQRTPSDEAQAGFSKLRLRI